MKGTYVLAVAFLASWTVATASQEQLVQPDHPENEVARTDYHIFTYCPFPEISPWNHTTNIAHENDCTKFYKCFLGRRVSQLCPYMEKGSPRRLHYNIFKRVCDWPWQAGCESCPEKDDDDDYLPRSLIPHESNDCDSYYECVRGDKHLRRCPSGTCFSRTCQKCVRNPRGGICDGSPEPPPPPPTRRPTPPPTRPPRTTPEPDPICRTGNRRSHHCDCGKYYECHDNEDWVLQECDGGLHFSPTTQRCLPPNEANCPIPRL